MKTLTERPLKLIDDLNARIGQPLNKVLDDMKRISQLPLKTVKDEGGDMLTVIFGDIDSDGVEVDAEFTKCEVLFRLKRFGVKYIHRERRPK